jgi:hypothetical protein
MRAIGVTIGYIIVIVTGILMFIFWLTAMSKWLGIVGIILAFILAPGLVIFPLIFWIVEGVFPAFYFMMWGIGIVGMLIAGMSTRSE